MFSLLYGLYEYLFRKRELRLLLLGVDRAGKTTTLEALKAVHSQSDPPPPLPRTQPPALPTVGLNIGRLEAEGCKVVLWDLGGAPALRPIWDKYYAEAHALLYVIDAAAPDRLEDSRAALEKALSARELDGAPLLLLAAKADLAGAGVASEVVRSALGSLARGCEGGERERAVRLVETCSLTGAGLREGLAWVLEAARRARRTRLLDAAAER